MKRIDPRAAGALALLVSLAACVAPPMGPTIPVAPGPGKTFDAFTADQQVCSQFAYNQTAAGAAAANNQAVGTALFTTALGAAIGGAVGGGRGAAIGAASGAGLGTVVGRQQLGLCPDVAAAAIRRDVRRVHGGPRQPGARLRAATWGANVSGLWPAVRLRPAAGLRSAAGLPAVLTPMRGRSRSLCGAAFRLSVRKTWPSPRRRASDRAQTIASSSESKWRIIGAIFAVPLISSHSSTKLAHTPAGAVSKVRVSFIRPPFAPFFPVADNADPGYTHAGRLIY